MESKIKRALSGIPDYQAFLTVDEMDASSRRLAAEYPGRVTLREIGRSRGNLPLLCMKISCDHPRSGNALMLGCPHPNEPIGVMMLEYMTLLLAEDEELRETLGYDWYIVKAWDVDGVKLNEGWFKGPFTLTDYFQSYFRPAGHEQVDWTFPIKHKLLNFNNPIPETRAVMDLIDKIQPRFIYALHNAGFGGTYWYTTRPIPQLFEAMKKVSLDYNVPLHLGEPESPSAKMYAPAFYANLGIRNSYDYAEFLGRDMGEYARNLKSGDCSASYAGDRWGTFTLLTELPYFYDERIADQMPSDMTRLDATCRKWDESEATTAEIRAILDPVLSYVDPDDAFIKAVNDFTQPNKNLDFLRKKVKSDSAFLRLATVAECFDNLLVSRFYKALTYGMAVRALENTIRRMPGDNAVATALSDMQAAFNRKAAYLEEHMDYRPVPIRNLVAIQLASGLMVANHLSKNMG